MNIEHPSRIESPLTIVINGSHFNFPNQEMTIEDILKYLKIDGDRVAVALNEAHVSKAQRALRVLLEGDRLEILSPMVGG